VKPGMIGFQGWEDGYRWEYRGIPFLLFIYPHRIIAIYVFG